MSETPRIRARRDARPFRSPTILARPSSLGGLSDLERDAFDKSRAIVEALMTPGSAYPSQRQLRRAWRAIQALDRAARRNAQATETP